MTAALLLAQRGFKVDIFEQTPALGALPIGIQLTPNAMYVLRELGVAEEIEKAGDQNMYVRMRHFKTGKPYNKIEVSALNVQRYGEKYLHIERAKVIDILLQAAEGLDLTVHHNAYVQGYTQNADEVTLSLQGGKIVRGSLLIGADGIYSTVREGIYKDMPPQPTGVIAWRGTVKAADLPKELDIPNYNLWIGDRKHFVTYGLNGGEVIHFTAVEENGSVLLSESRNVTGNMKTLRASFEGWDENIMAVLDAANGCFVWGVVGFEPLPTWYDGRVVLCGDACHPLLPSTMQGAPLTIESAFVLAQEISQTENHFQAFQNYQLRHQNRVLQIQRNAESNMKFFHKLTPWGKASRYLQLLFINYFPNIYHKRLDNLFSHNVTK